MKKIILTILMIALSNGFVFAQTEPLDTDGNGYRNISTLDELRWVSENDSSWSWNFELDNDINASDTKNWNGNLGFSPIGTNYSTRFSGEFEGHGYKIESLYINRPSQSNVAIFGYIGGAEIRNVGVVNCDIKGDVNVGGLVGGNYRNSTVINSYSKGSIEGKNEVGGLVGSNFFSSTVSNSYSKSSVSGTKEVGGLVGNNSSSTVINSYSTSSVSGSEVVGGLVGRNSFSIVSKSYSTGSVFGTEQVGGLLGDNYSSTVINSYSTSSVSGSEVVGGLVGRNSFSIVSNSYSTGSVFGTEQVGGLVGFDSKCTVINSYSTGSVEGDVYVGGLLGSNSSSTVINSYSTGSVSGTEQVGGLVGYNQASTVAGSFWNTQTSGQTTSSGGTGKTTVEMKTKSTFINAGWNFDFIWDISTAYPVIDIDTTYRPSDTDADGYLNISTLTDLRWLSESGFDLDSNFELDNNINASDTKNWHGNLGFSPIGINSVTNFSGVFEGHGFEIDSLYINRPNQSYVGFFGYIGEAEIRNVGVVNCDIKGDVNVGGLVGGNNRNSTVINSYSTGSIEGKDEVGGLVGGNTSSTLSNSYSTSSVSGTKEVGGLVGNNSSSTVINSCSTGSVEGVNNVGSLVGKNYNSNVIDSYSTSSVSGSEEVGGIVGSNYRHSTVINSYSTGSVEGVYNVGGLVGFNEISTVNNSYSTGSVSGSEEVGGLVGDNYRSTVINSYSTSNISGTEQVGGLVGANTDFSNLINTYSIGSVSGSEHVGGLVGFNQESNVKGSFWDMQTSGIDSSAGATGKTTEEMKMKSTFTDAVWNFDFIWDISTAYPVIDIDTNYRPSDTDADGYLNISTLKDLRWLSESGYDLDSDWELDSDIDASGTKNWNNSLGFSPIGINNTTNFSGKFEGHGYIIYSLFINRPTQISIGLFGYIDDAEIRNVGVVNCDITGYGSVGALVGGNSSYSIVSNSFSTGSVSGIGYVGGLVGYNHISKVSNSYSRCSVEGDSYVGGLVGSHYLSSSIFNCYSTGSVSGTEQVGGLVGENFSSEMLFSFWDTQTSGQTTSASGTGKTTEEMKKKSTFTDVGWDFEEIWKIDGITNDGYPYFRDEPTSILEYETIPEKNIFVYPNPASDYIEISLNKPSCPDFIGAEGSDLAIYDVLGNVVWKFTENTLTPALSQRERELKIDISHLPRGVYFVRVGDRVEKFVKR